MKPLPLPLRLAAGLAVTAAERARELPKNLVGLPVTVVSQVLQFSMRLQQQVTELAIKGDEVLSALHPVEDAPSWATFDEDLPPVGEAPTGNNGHRSTAVLRDVSDNVRDPWEQEERALAEDHTEGEFDSGSGPDADPTGINGGGHGAGSTAQRSGRPDLRSVGGTDSGDDIEAVPGSCSNAEAAGAGAGGAGEATAGGDTGLTAGGDGEATAGRNTGATAGRSGGDVETAGPGSADDVEAGGAESGGNVAPGGAESGRDVEADGDTAPDASVGDATNTSGDAPTISDSAAATTGSNTTTSGDATSTSGSAARTMSGDTPSGGAAPSGGAEADDLGASGPDAIGIEPEGIIGSTGLANYDELTLPQLRARLRRFTLEQLEELLAYERARENRPSFVGMLTRRIGNVQRLSEGDSGTGTPGR